jgi:phosphohistidine swiveling domain-containing protein
MNLQKLSKFKWHFIHKRKRSPFYTAILWEGSTRHHNNKLNFPYEVDNFIYLDTLIAVEEKNWKKLRGIIGTQLQKNHKFLIKLLHDSYRMNEKNEEWCRHIQGTNMTKVDKKYIIDKWQEYIQALNEFTAYLILPLFVEEDMQNHLRTAIAKKFPDLVEEIFHIFTTPQKRGITHQEKLALLKLAVRQNSGKKISAKEIKDHLFQFCWIKNNSFEGKFYNEEELRRRITDSAAENPKHSLAKHLIEDAESRKKYRLYYKECDHRTQHVIDTLQEAIYFRSWRTERYYRNAYFLQNFYAKVAETIGLTEPLDLFYLTPYEILDILKGKAKTNPRHIKERKLGYFVFEDKKEFTILSGKELAAIKKKVQVVSEIKNTEIKGQTAYPGFIIGKVRVIKHKSEFHTVKDGEIIVTSSTTPDFIPVLKKVTAIIAEEGGVLSHASVISRELRIPCIIGTKTATKVFKNGDMIEVDANKGIAKKI